MSLKIDVREHELIEKCKQLVAQNPKFQHIQIAVVPLELGDIILSDGTTTTTTTTDYVIIERKSIADLAASIKDGRYEEQSYRLNGLDHHNHNIVYLIEGDMAQYQQKMFNGKNGKKGDGTHIQTLYSAIFSVCFFKGFSVLRTMNMNETAEMMCCMLCKLMTNLKKKKPFFYPLKSKMESKMELNVESKVESKEEIKLNDNNNNDNNNNNNNNNNNEEKETIAIPNGIEESKQYCSVVKKCKKENINGDNIGEIMLCQIPGVSALSAMSILKEYKTLPQLIKAIQENKNCLDAVCTIDSNGKKRKMNKTTIQTIIQYLSV